jgi:hypothetical protein
LSSAEFVVGGVSFVVACLSWGHWYRDLLNITRFGEPGRARMLLAAVPILSLTMIFLTVRSHAALEVRQSPVYLSLYTVLGAAWLGLSWSLAPWLGISARDDVLEHNNRAALWPTVAVFVAAASMYTGGNIGEGPGIHAVLASVGLATGSWLVLWQVYEVSTHAAEKITVERDRAAGWKLAALLVANGFLLGVAAAGDWIPGEVLSGFIGVAVYAVVLTAIATVLDRKIERAWPAYLYLLFASGVYTFYMLGQR